ncbi:hypothetical protein T4A_5725 [Trichinella pseudospiralis]|uniref:Uncharacterized protein n=1 Tax=Trichinella pseudospiralis TaxID=6337 RepID=A0A0V1DWG7_TRIPS|nr:hypothetical protein T4A_5725 [Trichinella pseudospiralis]
MPLMSTSAAVTSSVTSKPNHPRYNINEKDSQLELDEVCNKTMTPAQVKYPLRTIMIIPFLTSEHMNKCTCKSGVEEFDYSNICQVNNKCQRIISLKDRKD